MLDFKVQKIQLALFSNNFNLTNMSSVANELKTKTENIFDGQEAILPLPIDAPSEIPRIILKSADNSYSCNIALSRTDFFFQDISEGKKLEEVIKDYSAKAEKIYSYFVSEKNVRIGRIGFVVNFVSELSNSSKKLLQDNIFQDKFYFAQSDKLKNIALIFSEKDKLDKFEISRLIKIESLRKKSNPDDDKKIAIQYDINTLAEKANEYILSTEDIKNILNLSYEEMELNLNKFLSL